MSDERLETTLREFRVPDYIERAREASLARLVASSPTKDTEQANPEKLPRYGFVYESQGVAAYQQWVAVGQAENLDESRSCFLNSFACWRSIVTLANGQFDHTPSTVSSRGLQLINSELGAELLSPELTLALHLAVAGLVSERTAETRLELNRFQLPPEVILDGWRDQVESHVFSAFVLLVRKAGGWGDIDSALGSINRLRELQKQYEDEYINGRGDDAEQANAAVALVGLYHLAQLVTLTGEYLRDGSTAITHINIRLDRHHDRALAAFRSAQEAVLSHAADLLWIGCRELAQNAIWTHVNSLGADARRFAKLLAYRGRLNPVIELWPSQQKALRRNLLDPYQRAILVEMPTSAGKTLLAKFAIVQTKALNPQGVIAYIVPTRALVNQITLDLREDFRDFGYAVEQAVPAFELDPTEERLLESAPDVLVTTPEKLDLLIRRDHPATREIALVIADEAHNIREKGRGARLELLLGTIKRDRAGARFLLLSPFLPNDDELVLWLGDDRGLPPISVDWKPSRKLVGAVSISGRGSKRAVRFETLPAADNADVREGMQVDIGQTITGDKGTTISGVTQAAVRSMLRRGAILILCQGQRSAMTRARKLAEELPELPSSPLRESVCRYIEAEIGRRPNLVQLIRRGVAYHHAGLSHETRWLIEGLIRRGLVQVICGTTTLAQGMNFPIATAIVETLEKGDVALTYQDFWNIAGRAGRTLVDTLGVVAFPTRNKSDVDKYKKFLRQEALLISSQLARLIERADELTDKFNDFETLRNYPELAALMQFLAHAMRVSVGSNIADEVEDLLRASLAYHQAKRQGNESVRKFVQLCRAYLEQISSQRGILTLADQTGFTTPSVLRLMAQRNDIPEINTIDDWQPKQLFSDDIGPLSQRVRLIAGLPEMQLGPGAGQPFNADRVASILRDWVRGDTLSSLATRYPLSDEPDTDRQVADFSRYLFSSLLGRASWGLGALEAICLAGKEEAQWEDAGYVPSMIFFGVQRKEAIWLRMVGVPRVVADGLGKIWQQRQSEAPGTYNDIRSWVEQLSDDDWGQVIPSKTSLTPNDMKLIWREFAGAAPARQSDPTPQP